VGPCASADSWAVAGKSFRQFLERKPQGDGEAVRNRRTGARSPVRDVDL
jgi:hypothetical protein